jgi:hypothetical protein
MALVLLGGIVTSLAVTLVILPALYLWQVTRSESRSAAAAEGVAGPVPTSVVSGDVSP